MSRRPKIHERHEKRAEREIQKKRKERDRSMKKRMAKSIAAVPEPYIRSFSRGEPERGIPKKVREWIATEDADQMRHYRKIARAMEKLTPLRNKWLKEFFARITGPRGYSVHAGTRKTIDKKDIPKRPRRPWRVVW